jgi:hypothetical protein
MRYNSKEWKISLKNKKKALFLYELENSTIFKILSFLNLGFIWEEVILNRMLTKLKKFEAINKNKLKTFEKEMLLRWKLQ